MKAKSHKSGQRRFRRGQWVMVRLGEIGENRWESGRFMEKRGGFYMVDMCDGDGLEVAFPHSKIVSLASWDKWMKFIIQHTERVAR